MNYKVRKSVIKLRGLFPTSPLKAPKRKQPGQAPGTMEHTGSRKIDEMLITLHDFDEDQYTSHEVASIDECSVSIAKPTKTWIQVRGVHDIDKLKQIGRFFNLHPLIQEDIVSTSQRAKVEPYEDMVFMVIRMITAKKDEVETGEFKTEQISIVLGSNYVLSFQESNDPVFNPIIKRLNVASTRLRRLGPDYLAYALIDNIVDHYFSALDVIGESIEAIEERIIENPKSVHLSSIHALRRDLIFFRKSVWSLRDGINSLIRDESPLIGSEVKIFLRDVYDHVVQVIDNIENHREMVYSLYDMYMSSLSNRMNEVMKVLTIIATIFIPLTFIAGIYGMNFNPDSGPFNMPELNWQWGYAASLLLMAIVAIVMLVFFKRKGWW